MRNNFEMMLRARCIATGLALVLLVGCTQEDLLDSGHGSIDLSLSSRTVRAISGANHPNLYFNSSEIAMIRKQIKERTAPRAAMEAWEGIPGVRSGIKNVKAVGKPSSIKRDMSWYEVYKIAQPRSKTNMEACMSYLVEPTVAKAKAMKRALLSWTTLTDGRHNWANGAQRGGHMQYPLAWMYDLLYNEGVLNEQEKQDVDEFFRKYAAHLLDPYGVSRILNFKEDVDNGFQEGLDARFGFHRDDRNQRRGGYDNFYTLDHGAGVVFALVSHSQALVDRAFLSGVPDNHYLFSHPAYGNGDIRTLDNVIRGEVYPSGYTFDGYKRKYGFHADVGFNGEDNGEGQHYHFYSLLGLIPAAEAAAHNGFNAWAYQNDHLLKGFTRAASWAHTAYRVNDPGNRNHTPLYWTILRRYPQNATIQQVVARDESRVRYSYFFSRIAPIWSLARGGITVPEPRPEPEPEPEPTPEPQPEPEPEPTPEPQPEPDPPPRRERPISIPEPVGGLEPTTAFDGVDDYVDLNRLDVAGDAITISAWINAKDLDKCGYNGNRDCRIVSKAVGTREQDHYFMLSTMAKGRRTQLRFRIKIDGTTDTFAAGSIQEGEWTHVAAVYGNGKVLLFVDGVRVKRWSRSGRITTSDAVDTWIGGNPPGATERPWHGELAKVRIYGDALTPNEIKVLADEQ